jgi:hypothetical protein
MLYSTHYTCQLVVFSIGIIVKLMHLSMQIPQGGIQAKAGDLTGVVIPSEEFEHQCYPGRTFLHF